MAISHCYWYLVVKNANFTFLLTSSGHRMAKFHIASKISTIRAHICPGVICNIVVKASFWQVSSLHMKCSTNVRYHPLAGISQMNANPRSDVRWSTQISCQIYSPAANIEFSGLAISHSYWHLVGQEMAISHCYWLSSGQEWQFHIPTDI